jgi:hypothetical protein
MFNMNESVYFLVLSLYLLFLIISYFILPNRKFKKVKKKKVGETILNLKPKERVSFSYKKLKISLKRNDKYDIDGNPQNKLIIEPYSKKEIELLFRNIGFWFSAFAVAFFFSVLGIFLDSINFLGSDSASDGYMWDYNWTHILTSWTGTKLGSIVYITFCVISGKYFRKKILNKFLIRKHKDIWEEFNLKYSKFKY